MEHFDIVKKRIEQVLKDYEELDSIRENIIKLNREILNNAVIANRLIASGDMEEARKYILKGLETFSSVQPKISGVERIEDRLFLYRILDEGLKELVEAILMYNRLTGDSLGLDLLPKVSNKVFIEGLFDYTGELRRKFLGYLLEGELDKAREIVDELSRLYDVLSIFIVKSYYLRDFRRRLDQLRSQLIRSLEDLANALYSRRGVK